MTNSGERIILDRVEKSYDFLVEETENRATIYDKRRSERLSDLLALLEYLRGDEDTDPLQEWFPEK